MESVAYPCLLDLLHVADHVSDLAWGYGLHGGKLGLDEAYLEYRVWFAEVTAYYCLPFLYLPAHHVEQTHHVLVVDEPAVH